MTLWKTPDVKPDDGTKILFIIDGCHCIGYYEKVSGLYVGTNDVEYESGEIDRWAYIEEVIASADRAERLTKAVLKASQTEETPKETEQTE